MTKEEASKYLKAFKLCTPYTMDAQGVFYQAIKVAIEALEQKTTEMSDATYEERDGIDKYIKSVSKPTDVEFWDSEKESFINKPCCISSEVCEHDKQKVLDKVRAEIVEMRSKQNCSCADCLDIIDKYRTESKND